MRGLAYRRIRDAVLPSRFPYGVVYEIRENDILIIAMAHSSREPFYWKGRIKKAELCPTAAWDMQKFWYNVTKADEIKYRYDGNDQQ